MSKTWLIYAEPPVTNIESLSGRVDTAEASIAALDAVADDLLLRTGAIFPRFDLANTGADAGDLLRTFIADLKTTATATNRRLLKLLPGKYNVSGVLDLGAYLDLDMRGAILDFTGTGLDSKLKIGANDVSLKNGTYLGLNVGNANLFYNATGHKYQEGLIGVDLINVQNSLIDLREVKNFTRSARLGAIGTNNYSAYNNIWLNSLVRSKVGITIESMGNGAWVNENKFFGGNFMPTSDLEQFGSCWGIEFKVSGASPYVGANQNVFYSPSFQLGEPLPWTPSSSGKRKFNLFYNPTTFIEYMVVSDGENQICGTDVPSHTSGVVVDNAGVSWQYVGPCRRSPVFLNGAGSYNCMLNARWEGGFGPFMVGKYYGPSTTTGYRTRGNVFQISLKQGINSLYPDADICDETCFDNSPLASAITNVTSYDAPTPNNLVFDNLHLRAVESAAGVTVPGFENGTATGTTADKNVGTGHIDILFDGLRLKNGSNGLALFLNTNKTKRFRFHYGLTPAAQNRGRIQLRCYDANKTLYADLQTVGVCRGWGRFETTNASSYSQSNTSKDDSAIATRHDTKFARVFFQGEVATKSIIHSIEVEAGSNLDSYNKSSVQVENRLLLDFNQRYSNGTPIAGAFLSPGQHIRNLSGTTGQPLFWTVTSTGYLCKSWATATLYVVGAMVLDGGVNYRCITEHTASAAFATDSANWVSIGSPAVLLASSQTY